MLNRSSTRMAAAVISAAALIGATTAPSYAHSARYCRDYAMHYSGRSNDDALIMILPLAAIGAGVGAVVGLAAAGISVGTGAIVGTGVGAGVGTAHAVLRPGEPGYDRAYAECRAQY